MDNKAKEILHNLVLDILKDHTKIIKRTITKCIQPITTVNVKVDTSDPKDESIIITFDNPVINYTIAFDLSDHIEHCIHLGINTAIGMIVVTSLTKFSNQMFDLFLKDPKNSKKF